ncbi:hypothetical protein PF004_g11098 [Phytophthora fragariae]|uniref:Uncharacterized protein n=1 Tax=Phytophthora fragariae TaxID=53985 RepID=A0A6G0NZ12_9STRA|nr:hypothetical protein PF004_g11098 [Phytophthora fragariae]
MLPWCDHVRGAVGYWEGESSDPLFQSYHGLKIHSPRKTSVSQSDEEADEQINSQRFHLREALKLLSVVALVDNNTWRKLLIQSRVLARRFAVPEELDGIPARFLLELPYGRRIPADDIDSLLSGVFVHDTRPEHVLRGDLVFFCGVEQHAKPSKKYKTSLKKIIEIWRGNLELGDVPGEIEVPLTIQVHPTHARSGAGLVHYTQNVLKAARHLRSQTWPPVGGRKGLPRVTFVLESIGADLRPVQIRSDVTALVETIARDGIYCLGISFWQQLGSVLAAPAKLGAARKSVGKLLTSLFGGPADGLQVDRSRVMTGPRASTSTAPGQIILDSLNIFSDPSKTWFFERACSAAVVNQTTTHISISTDLSDQDRELVTWRWRWICYGFFSERAQRLSRLQRLTLQNMTLTGEDVDAMQAVMASNYSEENLLGLPHPQQARNNFSIGPKKGIRLQPMDRDEVLGNNATFTVSGEVRGIKLLTDETDNGWVEVLVPGFGKCQTR